MTKEKKQEYLIITLLPFIMLIYSIVLSTPYKLIEGMKNILLSDGILITDYFFVGGKEAALFNASIITLINIYLLYKMDMKINGLVISGIFLMLGFSLMGKNILNIIPFYIGAYLYAKMNKKTFKSVAIGVMVFTSLSPLVCVIAEFFGYSLLGIAVALISGIILGFVIPPISAHVLHIHGGFSLYNTGFAAGLVAIVSYSILKAAKVEVSFKKDFTETMDYRLLILFSAIFLFYIIYGFIKNGYSFSGLKSLISHSGRLVSDFTVTEGFSVVVINMGILGFLCLGLILVLFPMFNGPILSGMITVIAFAGFGKHIKNISPVIVGIIIAFYLFRQNTSLTAFAITLFFSTTLAPISGKFGIFPGIIAGFLNYCLVSNIGSAHGGLNLYNTGLAAGIVASISVPILNLFQKGE